MSDLAAHIRALAETGTPGPFRSGTTGPRGGDHWFVTDVPIGDVLCHIRSDDGDNEEKRGADARKIVAAVKADLVEATEGHQKDRGDVFCCECFRFWPCPTARAARALDALAAALGVEP